MPDDGASNRQNQVCGLGTYWPIKDERFRGHWRVSDVHWTVSQPVASNQTERSFLLLLNLSKIILWEDGIPSTMNHPCRCILDFLVLMRLLQKEWRYYSRLTFEGWNIAGEQKWRLGIGGWLKILSDTSIWRCLDYRKRNKVCEGHAG